MLSFLRLAAGLAGYQAAARAGDTMRRLVLSLVAGLLALVGTGFLTAAGWLAIAHALGGIWASVIVGAGFLLLALMVVLAAGARRRPALQTEMDQLKTTAQSLLSEGLPGQIAKAPAVPLMGAFIGGLILALRLRR